MYTPVATDGPTLGTGEDGIGSIRHDFCSLMLFRIRKTRSRVVDGL